MSDWKPVDQDTFQKVLVCVNDDDKKILEYVYTHRISKLSSIDENFPEEGRTLADLLCKLGGINGKIFKKVNCAIYSKQPAHTLKDSTYALGILE